MNTNSYPLQMLSRKAPNLSKIDSSLCEAIASFIKHYPRFSRGVAQFLTRAEYKLLSLDFDGQFNTTMKHIDECLIAELTDMIFELLFRGFVNNELLTKNSPNETDSFLLKTGYKRILDPKLWAMREPNEVLINLNAFEDYQYLISGEWDNLDEDDFMLEPLLDGLIEDCMNREESPDWRNALPSGLLYCLGTNIARFHEDIDFLFHADLLSTYNIDLDNTLFKRPDVPTHTTVDYCYPINTSKYLNSLNNLDTKVKSELSAKHPIDFYKSQIKVDQMLAGLYDDSTMPVFDIRNYFVINREAWNAFKSYDIFKEFIRHTLLLDTGFKY